MAEKPAVVGLAVGIVENGRITFLNGYGETLAGSGDKVTPDTVFRWASVSKGVAATMIAKLAEEGKLSLQDPVSQYAASMKLPGGAEARATIGDLLSHRLVPPPRRWIGNASAIRILGDGRFEAAAETERGYGGSAMVVHPEP